MPRHYTKQNSKFGCINFWPRPSRGCPWPAVSSIRTKWGNKWQSKWFYLQVPTDVYAEKDCPFAFSCKTPKIISEPSVTLSSNFISIRSRVEELISKFSCRDLVEEFTCLKIRPLSSDWSLNLGDIPEGSSSLLPPFVIDSTGICIYTYILFSSFVRILVSVLLFMIYFLNTT